MANCLADYRLRTAVPALGPTLLTHAPLLLRAALECFGASASRPRAAGRKGPGTALFEGTRWFEPGQTGVTYRDLLIPHLRGADSISIVDPHIKTLRQIRYLQELLEDIASANQSQDPIAVHLITSDPPAANLDARLRQSELLVDLVGIAAEEGVRLNVTFDNTVHDRWIETDEWRIILGKGLDIWRYCPGPLNPGFRRQDVREVSKKFAVTYCRTS